MKSIFLKTILIFAISITICNFSYSQESVKKSSDSVKTKDEVSNSLNAKEWAILFGIGTDFTLTNFDDAVIAVKYHISPKSALRLDFNVNYNNENTNNSDNSVYLSTGSYINQYQSFGGNLAFLYYINPKEKFNIYFNLGINYTYSKESHSRSYSNSKGSDYFYEKSTNWLLGPKAGAGAEYFIFKSMSVFAEYNYFFGFGEQERKSSNGTETYTENSDVTLFAKDYLKFGLSVYF